MKSVKEILGEELEKFRNTIKIYEPGVLEKQLKDDAVKLLETEPIQFLKNRYQLGLLYAVSNNPDKVKHSRFEHTVGVVAKCIVACDIINSNTKVDRSLNEQDVRELVVAAALHDCGHLPISHATERAFLTAKGITSGVKHEERIIPLITTANPLFEDLRNVVFSWKGFDEKSFYRIASIISPELGNEFVKTIEGFVLPKKAIQQLLVSEIDMDRLDFVIRDSEKLDYNPVTLIKDKIAKYVKGLCLEKSKIIGGGSPSDNAEICLAINNDSSPDDNYLECAFYLLVSRVLLYKYVYFSEKVRSFEAILTYLVGTLIDKEISLDQLKLIAMTDEDFIYKYLDELVDYLDDTDEVKEHIKKKYVNVLKEEKVERFRHVFSIEDKYIGNPRLKEEFISNVDKRSYIDNIRDYLNRPSKHKSGKVVKLERSDILLDVFHLKAGGGDILVKSYEKKKVIYKTLKDYMNGSNMHRLCSEDRLDVYMKSDLSDIKKEFVKERLKSIFKYRDQ